MLSLTPQLDAENIISISFIESSNSWRQLLSIIKLMSHSSCRLMEIITFSWVCQLLRRLPWWCQMAHIDLDWSYLKYSQLRIPSYKDGASLLSQGSIKIEKKSNSVYMFYWALCQVLEARNFEIPTHGLKVRCSASELRLHKASLKLVGAPGAAPGPSVPKTGVQSCYTTPRKLLVDQTGAAPVEWCLQSTRVCWFTTGPNRLARMAGLAPAST